MARRYPERYLPISGREQAEHGAVISFRNTAGESLVLTRQGPITQVARELCDAAVAIDETFRVVCISTPSTIYGDLYGRQMMGNTGAERPEGRTLTLAGRRHMLHPDCFGQFRERD